MCWLLFLVGVLGIVHNVAVEGDCCCIIDKLCDDSPVSLVF